MINIFEQLKREHDFSNGEKTVAKYILSYPEKVLQYNAKELANECFVSMSVVYRLCDKLGISGYSDLKVKISQSLRDYHHEEEIDFDFPFQDNQTDYQVLKKLKENYEQSLSNTFDFFDLTELKHTVSAMAKAKSMSIYTTSGNLSLAENFKLQMREIGVTVEVPSNEYEQRLTAATSTDNQFAIIISYEGYLVNIDFLVSILQNNHVPILLISSPDYQLKNDAASFHLYMPPHGHRYNKVASFAERISVLYILDALYSCYFELDYHANLKKRNEYSQISTYNFFYNSKKR